LIYFVKPLALVYGLLIVFAGFYWVIRTQNRNEEVLKVCAYLMGVEVFLRMTKGTISHEFIKYAIMFFFLMGMFIKGFSRNAIPYWIFIVLLLPGLFIGILEVSGNEKARQIIIFNLAGPLCLTIASIYCYTRKIRMRQMLDLLLACGLPVIATVLYMVLYTPELKEVLTHTGSNFDTSGGFGPNQVATILGFGLFVFFARAIFASPSRWQLVLNLGIACFLTYRALLTFSRGGLITGLLMVLLLVFFVYNKGNNNARVKISLTLSVLGGSLVMIWLYTVFLTGGLIEKRYANQDAQGREKESISSGREEIAISEIELFLENPIFGGGLGNGTIYRLNKLDTVIASHNEVTRMLGEHGLFGILALLLLFLTPMILKLDNPNHFFMYSFLAFWFLTLNHAAMRTAAPAFVYALTLLKIQLDDVPVIRRKQAQ
jgi:hypothetical protein